MAKKKKKKPLPDTKLTELATTYSTPLFMIYLPTIRQYITEWYGKQ